MTDKFIVTNFAYGTGPFIHTVALAIDFNNQLEELGQERCGIIVPWVYGEKQRTIMLEEFSEHEKGHSGEILLNAALGTILEKVFYDGRSSFGRYLQQWAENFEGVCLEAKKYLSGPLDCETLSGKKILVDGRDIIVEINRSPRLIYGATPAYSSNFAFGSEIIERSSGIKSLAIHSGVLKEAAEVFRKIEATQKIHAIAFPGTFSSDVSIQPTHPNEILTPPIFHHLKPITYNLKPVQGIYITVTGISGLERLYETAGKLRLKLYSNNPSVVADSEKALPEIIFDPKIQLHFARSGWGSVWLSMFAECPLVLPDFDPKDDPEIYFNNQTIEKLGIGVVYRGQPLKELLAIAPKIKESQQHLKKEIQKWWGTLDGVRVAAEIFARDFLKNQPKLPV